MRLCDGEPTSLYVPEPIEPERTRIITRKRNDDPTTIFDLDEARAELPTARAKGSAQMAMPRVRSTKQPPPIPPRRRVTTPVSLDVSYEAAMRLFR